MHFHDIAVPRSFLYIVTVFCCIDSCSCCIIASLMQIGNTDVLKWIMDLLLTSQDKL